MAYRSSEQGEGEEAAMRVRYKPVPDRLAMWSVWLMGETAWLVGFIREEAGHWQARQRGQPQEKAVRGFLRRTDAARFLLIAGGFCRHRRTEPGGSG
jgi:hypothetical protein